jgi:mono/diheme cytochrome c family protein
MHAMKSFGVTAILLAVVSICAAQDTTAPASAQKAAPTVKHVPITQTASNSGKEMFNSYCAVCHGIGGKGDGPAAAALKVPPTDLTTLAQKNGGKFPSDHVSAVLYGQAPTAAHGSQDMPVWGPLFSSISQGNQGQVQQRIVNLVNYIGTLQVK